MGYGSNVYTGAIKVDAVTGIPQIGPFAGHLVTLSRHVGQASHGFRSGYTLRPCEWVRLEIAGERTRSFQYTGKNLANAARQLVEFRQAIAKGEVRAA